MCSRIIKGGRVRPSVSPSVRKAFVITRIKDSPLENDSSIHRCMIISLIEFHSNTTHRKPRDHVYQLKNKVNV